MPSEILLSVLAGAFFLVLAYVAWLKVHEHVRLHRSDQDSRHHHLVAVRHFRTKKRRRPKQSRKAESARS